jgi:hypothetical protein
VLSRKRTIALILAPGGPGPPSGPPRPARSIAGEMRRISHVAVQTAELPPLLRRALRRYDQSPAWISGRRRARCCSVRS